MRCTLLAKLKRWATDTGPCFIDINGYGIKGRLNIVLMVLDGSIIDGLRSSRIEVASYNIDEFNPSWFSTLFTHSSWDDGDCVLRILKGIF